MIDLRSDILGRVPQAALDALAAAASDQPGFAYGEDRHERALAEEISDLFGFEAALFVPTCTMANQIAVGIACAAGEIVIADRGSHVAVNELSSTSGLNAASLHLIAGDRGHLSSAQVEAALIATARASQRRARLVWLENTHNREGGTVMPAGWVRAIGASCATAGVHLHVDGARIWNAIVASQIAPRLISQGADSLAISLNKGIGAPLGAMILGPREFIDEAQRMRKMFGGWWRPAGLLAAAARAALQGFEPRITADHRRAREFADSLRAGQLPGIEIDIPQTNIVMMQMPHDDQVPLLLRLLWERGIGASDYGESRARFVFHAGISDRDVQAASDIVADVIEEMSPLAVRSV